MMDLFIWAMALFVVGFSYWCGRSDCQKNGCFRNNIKENEYE
jgi:hypothetical protein